MQWHSDDCFDDDNNFICTNIAGAPLHFDFAIQGFTEEETKKMGIWKPSTNPRVTATKIDCPKKLIKKLQQYCGKNSGSTTDPSDYCKGVDWSKQHYWPPK